MANCMFCELCSSMSVNCVGDSCLLKKYIRNVDDLGKLNAHCTSALLRDVLQYGDEHEPEALSLWIRSKLEDIRVIGRLHDMINHTRGKTFSSIHPQPAPPASPSKLPTFPSLGASTTQSHPPSPSIHPQPAPPASPSRSPTFILARDPRITRASARKRTVSFEENPVEPVPSEEVLVEQRPRTRSEAAKAALVDQEVRTRKRKGKIPCHKMCNCKRVQCLCYKKRMQRQDAEQDVV